MPIPIVHIVKRFGRVGGMESYVWHLVHGLVKCGVQVAVVCEQVCEPPVDSILVFTVEASPERPRWKSMLGFRERVDQKIRQVFFGQAVLIHSHERSLCHQVTTFHGPPIEPSRGFSWFSRFTRRFNAWKQMEREELLGPDVQMVLSVSSLTEMQLINAYPELVDKSTDLAWPGVHPSKVDPSLSESMSADHPQFLFVGKEWKRKGLDLAIGIVDEFRKSYAGATLTVFGVEEASLPYAIRGFDWVTFRGWVPAISWSDFDMLIHPARKEPFGMVVAEARGWGLPVLISSKVGAKDLNFSDTRIIDATAPSTEWCRAALELLETNKREPELKWSWSDLVLKHIEQIYPRLKAVNL